MSYIADIATNHAVSRMATESRLSSRLLRMVYMTRKSNREYYEKREAMARAAAEAASLPQARVLHLEMAYRYAAKAREDDLEREIHSPPEA